MVTDYFAAPTDALAATVGRELDGPSTPARGSGEPLFDTVRVPSTDPFVALATLGGLLSGRTYAEVTALPRHAQVISGGTEGPWVVTVSELVTTELAGAAPARLTAVARTTDEDDHRAAVLADALRELGELAGRARSVRHTLYCWAVLPGLSATG
ncbi:hypothetical protein GCM10009718_02160 [Isoptericola halotolerans]